MSDDDGITLIPIGPGSGTATKSAQFAADTAAFLRRFANNPAALIISVVSGFVVTVIFGFFEFLVGAVLYPFDLLVGGLAYVQRELVATFGWLGIDILAFLADLQGQLAGIVATAGPAGPFLAMGVAAVAIYVTYRVVLALVVLVPGGDSLLTLLNLR